MSHDAFWDRVNAALDARADPLNDPQVARALELEPERLGELLRLESALAALPVSKPRRRAAGLAAISVAAAAAAGLALLLFAAQRGASGPESAPIARASAGAPFELAPCLGVLELRVTHTVTSHDAQRTTQVDVLAARSQHEVVRNEPSGHLTSFSFATLHSIADSP